MVWIILIFSNLVLLRGETTFTSSGIDFITKSKAFEVKGPINRSYAVKSFSWINLLVTFLSAAVGYFMLLIVTKNK